ncbi:MarR family transcriptional regulator [Microbacterium sp. NPDC028030]|uniref:MarR family winged helix-turn-helix transcriptional regulator n=1 Tax=Microbacterium sp. NPDC028030 TaxID=3155124 RepID=UPI0033F68D52
MNGPSGATAGAMVWRLANRWRTAVDRAVREHGLTHATYVLLTTLHSLSTDAAGSVEAAPSQRELAAASGIETEYVSRLIRALEADGMVHRTRDDHDSRIVRLRLTARASTTIGPAMQTVQELLEKMLSPLGGRDTEAASEFVVTLGALLAATTDEGEHHA